MFVGMRCVAGRFFMFIYEVRYLSLKNMIHERDPETHYIYE